MNNTRFVCDRSRYQVAGWGVLLACVFLLTGSGFAQSLRIEPSITIPSDFQFTVDVVADCMGSQVKGVETAIVFDPYLVRLDSISPGSWFTGAPGDFFFWDYTSTGTGRIHFTGSLLEAPNSIDGPLATCHFTGLSLGQTPLVFQDVDVRDAENMDLGFGHSTGDLIILDGAVNNRLRTFGALKAIYR